QRHTIDWPPLEYAAWLVRLATARRRDRRAERVTSMLTAHRRTYFVFPLQLEGDFQIRARAPFKGQADALDIVISSFAAHAPNDAHLTIKTHPLENGLMNWSRIISRLAEKHDLTDRVHVLDGGNLAALIRAARGVVTINSSAGL